MKSLITQKTFLYVFLELDFTFKIITVKKLGRNTPNNLEDTCCVKEAGFL